MYCLRGLSLEALQSSLTSMRLKEQKSDSAIPKSDELQNANEEVEVEEEIWRAEIDGVFVSKSFENLSENEIPEGFRMLAGVLKNVKRYFSGCLKKVKKM